MRILLVRELIAEKDNEIATIKNQLGSNSPIETSIRQLNIMCDHSCASIRTEFENCIEEREKISTQKDDLIGHHLSQQQLCATRLDQIGKNLRSKQHLEQSILKIQSIEACLERNERGDSNELSAKLDDRFTSTSEQESYSENEDQQFQKTNHSLTTTKIIIKRCRRGQAF